EQKPTSQKSEKEESKKSEDVMHLGDDGDTDIDWDEDLGGMKSPTTPKKSQETVLKQEESVKNETQKKESKEKEQIEKSAVEEPPKGNDKSSEISATLVIEKEEEDDDSTDI